MDELYDQIKDLEDELEEREERIRVLEGAMQWFVDRCEIGQVRSKRTYERFKTLLKGDT